MRRPTWGALGALALGGLLTGCAATLDHPHASVTASPGSDGVQHVKVVTHSFWFEPDSIVVKAGAPVDLEVHNGSFVVPHNFSIRGDEAGLVVDRDVSFFKGAKHVTFTPSKPGTYRFFCDKDKHGEKGMRGTLVVVP